MSTILSINDKLTSAVKHSEPAMLNQSDEDKENQRVWNGRIVTINRAVIKPVANSESAYEADFISVQLSPNSKSKQIPKTMYVRTPAPGYWKRDHKVKFHYNEMLRLENVDKPSDFPYMKAGNLSDDTPIFF